MGEGSSRELGRDADNLEWQAELSSSLACRCVDHPRSARR